VKVHWAAWEKWVILKQLGLWLAILFGAAGVTCMVFAAASLAEQTPPQR
jgi:hypothetical protein